ncbi:MAG: GAF domain-containing protein [Roseiflexaceae bacterium]|nr:GAF domain-containing protein [Roseiflexaceae bacterium]
MSKLVRQLLLPMRHWPLANLLTFVMVLVAAIAVLVLFVDLNQSNRREIEALQVDHLHNNATDLAAGLDALVGQQMGRISNLALSRSVVEFATVRPDQRSALFTPTLADFTNVVASSSYYRAVLLIDQRGEVLISTEGSYVGQRFTNSAFFQNAMRGEPHMSDPGISRLDRQPVIWLAAPVFAAAGAQPVQPIGIVAVTLSPEWLWQYVEARRLGENGYAMLVDQYGIRLAHGADRRYIFRSIAPLPEPTWQQLKLEDRFGPLGRIAVAASPGLAAYLASTPLLSAPTSALMTEQSRVHYSAVRMQSRPWAVVTMLPDQEVLAPADRATTRGLLATLAVAVLLSATVWWTTQRILKPVPQLSAAAGKIAQGDFSTPVSVHGSSELHTLAVNFESMRQRLRASHGELATWASTLESRVAQRSQELAALSEVVAAASRTQSRAELLHTALDQALAVVGADIGGIWIADAQQGLRLMATRGFDQELCVLLGELQPGEGLLGQVQLSGQPIALADVSSSPQLSRAAVREQGLHAFAAVPLRIHGRTLGVIGLFSRAETAFNPDKVALAASIAQQIALVLDNLVLLARVEMQASAVASLQERERIAGDIHDSVAQVLSYLFLQTDRLALEVERSQPQHIRDQLGKMQDVIASATNDVRSFIARLQDVAPPPICLAQALREQVAALADELDVELELVCREAEGVRVDAATSAELLRIAGESARNARRHGRASHIKVALELRGAQARLLIADNGTGFEPNAQLPDGRQHFGLSVMRARAARIGGTFELASCPGGTTLVTVAWPIEAQ